KRGLTGVRMFTSDSHEGLKAALRAVCPGVPWQRCQFYLQQNASHYVPKVEMRKKAASDIKAIFNAADEHQAAELLKKTVEAYHKTAPRLA
ncbi:MAG: putative transposase, partial [Planctomycetota bacterium]